jgi:hypothetical protein
MDFAYKETVSFTAALSSGIAWGFQMDATTSFDFNGASLIPNTSAATNLYELTLPALYPPFNISGTSFLGAHVMNAMEQGDGTNAVTFNAFGTNALMGTIWC